MGTQQLIRPYTITRNKPRLLGSKSQRPFHRATSGHTAIHFLQSIHTLPPQMGTRNSHARQVAHDTHPYHGTTLADTALGLGVSRQPTNQSHQNQRDTYLRRIRQRCQHDIWMGAQHRTRNKTRNVLGTCAWKKLLSSSRSNRHAFRLQLHSSTLPVQRFKPRQIGFVLGQ
jgi:hypothetical protein